MQQEQELPAADPEDTEGHKKNFRAADPEDTEGHKKNFRAADPDKDTEGHKKNFRAADPDNEDAEGHKKNLRATDPEDTEGHKKNLRATEDPERRTPRATRRTFGRKTTTTRTPRAKARCIRESEHGLGCSPTPFSLCVRARTARSAGALGNRRAVENGDTAAGELDHAGFAAP